MVLLIGVMLLLMLLGIPIGYAIGIASLFYVVFVSDISAMVIAQQISAGADSLVMVALPFFLLAGEIMNESGITQKLTRFALSLIGPIRGGLSHVVVIANVLVAMVSGAAIANAAAVGSTMIPIMVRKGYPKDFAAAVNAASSIIGAVIPPSVGFIIYASVSGVSVGKLFLAGTVPGILLAIGMIIVCAIIAKIENHPKGESYSIKEFCNSFIHALPGLFMPIIVLGGIFSGVVTPTEAGALAVVYGLVVGLFVYRTLKFRNLPSIFLNAAKRSASILFIIAGAACFGFLLSREMDVTAFVRFFHFFEGYPALMMLSIIGVILLLGMFMEGGSIMVILTPFLLPLVVSFGIDPVHFGVVFQIAIMVGLLTPPLGILLFVISGTSDVPIKSICFRLLPFFVIIIMILLLVAFVPSISLWLVQQQGKNL
ncbi:MAG: TRAP transporter large permease [Planctomycetaceae bacterium]|jgi:C4-dicarboxylate transporter DctM subunit|nr:TRAP transporter large permease [Planctomycetaceae bacterium]